MSNRFIARLAGGAIIVSILVAATWMLVPGLLTLPRLYPAFYPALMAAGGTLMFLLVSALWAESNSLRNSWLRRTAVLAGLPDLEPLGLWEKITARIPDPLEWLTRPLWRTRLGRRIQAEWIDSGLGSFASRYLFMLILTGLGGYVLGMRIGGPLLGISFALVAPLLPRTLVAGRAQAQRRRFSEQLPQLLELVASGMAAGMSFQQSVEFSRGELLEPIRAEINRLSARLALGWPVDAALESLDRDRDEEGLRLVVEGLILQRQFGGDMVRMLEEISDLLRERVELEGEIRAVSTQGRLSGAVIAALVPASAAFLLAFNPRYIDILFDTFIGQVLVVVTIVLQLAGWAVISRLVRIRF